MLPSVAVAWRLGWGLEVSVPYFSVGAAHDVAACFSLSARLGKKERELPLHPLPPPPPAPRLKPQSLLDYIVKTKKQSLFPYSHDHTNPFTRGKRLHRVWIPEGGDHGRPHQSPVLEFTDGVGVVICLLHCLGSDSGLFFLPAAGTVPGAVVFSHWILNE